MLYILLKLLAIFVFNVLYQTKLSGFTNIPKKGKVILVANHCSFLDPMVIFHSSPRRFYAVASKWLFNIWWLGYALRLLSCVPTNGSSKGAVSILNNEGAILIFPEGKCCDPDSYTASVAHTGVAVFALKTGSPVIPIYVNGTYAAWPSSNLLPKFFKRIEVCFGQPLYFEKIDRDIVPQDTLREVTAKIMNEISRLKRNNGFYG